MTDADQIAELEARVEVLEEAIRWLCEFLYRSSPAYAPPEAVKAVLRSGVPA